ncbi:hypothetical protein [Streptomyces sp. NPDC029674]|uniref:hypothetical protein n=1 Tax=Streptomyces sp. NPDC029674 TaxID=3365297 RepID=UPI00384F6877
MRDDRAGRCGPSACTAKAALAQATAAGADDHSPTALARTVPGDKADEHADRLGFDGDELWTRFGPTNCKLYRVTAHAALADLPRERRSEPP